MDALVTGFGDMLHSPFLLVGYGPFTFEKTLILQISGGQNNIQWALPSIKHEKNNEKKSIKKI